MKVKGSYYVRLGRGETATSPLRDPKPTAETVVVYARIEQHTWRTSHGLCRPPHLEDLQAVNESSHMFIA